MSAVSREPLSALHYIHVIALLTALYRTHLNALLCAHINILLISALRFTAVHCTHIKCTVYAELNRTTTLALTQIHFIKFNPMLQLWVNHTSPGKQGEQYFLENVLSSNGILSMGRGGLFKMDVSSSWVSITSPVENLRCGVF